MALDGDVIVNVDLRGAPFAQLVTARRERAQRRAFGGLEATPSTPRELLKRPRVHAIERIRDGVREFGERVKHVVAERRQNLALDDLYRRLDLGLIARMPDARGEDRRAVVRREILICRVHDGFVIARRRDPRLLIVWRDY